MQPAAVQVACFDTGFHRNMPAVARMYGIPRSYTERGLRRFGFHGLSCESVMNALERDGGSAVRTERVISSLILVTERA